MVTKLLETNKRKLAR